MAEFNFPDDTIPFEKKGKKYMLEWCQAVFSYSTMYPQSFMNRNILVTGADGSRSVQWTQGWIGVNRRYARGDQSPELYKPRYAASKGEEGEDQSFMNIDWRIEPFATKIINIIVERILKRWTYIDCTPLDPEAVDEEREAFFMDLAKVKNKGQLAMVRGMMGLPESDGMDAQTPDEVEMERDAGKYKSKLAEAAEQVIMLMMNLSGWPELLKNGLYKNLIPANKLAYQVRTGANGWPKVEFVPIEEMVSPWTQHDDYSDAQWQGRVHLVNWNTFRKIAAPSGKSEEELRLIFNKDTQFMSGSVKLCRVVEVFLKDCMPIKAKMRKTPRGDEAELLAPGKEYKPESGSTGRAYSKDVEIVMHSMWVPSCDEVLFGGPMEDMPRQRNKLTETMLPLKVVCPNIDGFEFKSVIDVMIPRLDTLQNLVLNKRNLIANIGPDGIDVFDYAVNNILDGKGGQYDTFTFMKQGRQTGFYIRGGLDPETGKPYYNQQPIGVIPNKEATKVMEILQLIEAEYNGVLELVGLTAATSATTTDPKTLNGALQVQAAGTESALRFLSIAVDRMAEMVAYDMFLRFQASSRQGKVDKSTTEALGRKYGNVIKHTADLDLNSFGIEVKQGLSADELFDIKDKANTLLNVNMTNPAAGITAADYQRIINTPNPSTAWRILDQSIRRREREARQAQAEVQKREVEKIQEANKGAQEKQAQLHQQKMELVALNNEAKTSLETVKNELKAESKLSEISLNMDLQLRNQEIILQQQAALDQRLAAIEAREDKDMIRIEGDEARKTEIVRAENAPAPKSPAK